MGMMLLLLLLSLFAVDVTSFATTRITPGTVPVPVQVQVKHAFQINTNNRMRHTKHRINHHHHHLSNQFFLNHNRYQNCNYNNHYSDDHHDVDNNVIPFSNENSTSIYKQQSHARMVTKTNLFRSNRSLVLIKNLFNPVKQSTNFIQKRIHYQILTMIQQCKSIHNVIFHRKIRKLVVSTMFLISLLFTSLIPIQDAIASSGGRVGGGSFNRSRPSPSGTISSSSRSTSTSSSGSGTSLSRKLSPTRYIPSRTVIVPQIFYHHHSSTVHPHVLVHHFSGSNQLQYTRTASVIKDVLLLTGTGALIAYGLANNAYRTKDSDDDNNDNNNSYGPTAGGATIASITVSLDVPNKDDPNSILSRLNHIATTANTVSNRGLQDLVTAVTIELTRQQSSIDSASVSGQYYRVVGQAEREFRILSVKQQSKVDRLTVNKFQGENKPDERQWSIIYDTKVPTKAVITLNIAMGGNLLGPKKQFAKVTNRNDLINLLTQIGSDVQLEDNHMIAAEIFWSPEEPNDILTQDELYFKYPELIPL